LSLEQSIGFINALIDGLAEQAINLVLSVKMGHGLQKIVAILDLVPFD